MDINRRNFICTCIAFTLMPKISLASAGDVRLPLRPPGARAENEFIARCNKCQKCIQICPTRVIFPASLEYGITKTNTPIISFKNSYCNSCLKCSLICPTGALEPVTEKTLDIGVGKIIESDCVAWDWIGCTICIDKCPLKAIYLDENKRPVVTPEKCNGCGICQKECPSTSIGRGKKGKGILVVHRDNETPARIVE